MKPHDQAVTAPLPPTARCLRPLRRRCMPTAAVLPTKTAAPTYLHELDRRTNDVVTHLTAAMASALIGDAVRIPGAAEPLPLLRKMAPLELKRRKRAFDKLATTDPIAVEAIVPRFVAYLSAALRDGGDA